VGSWIAYEVVLNLVEGLQLPAWLPGAAIVLFIIGLPIVLATAFVQEGTPFQSPPEPTEKAAAKVFNWKNAVLGGVVAFLLLAVTAGGWVMLRKPSELSTRESAFSVAALPFENLSADKEDEYFTDGFHDELLTQLSKIGSLRVISRTSVLGYKGTTKNLKAIADELGVRYILEGSVRRFGDRVKITAQLIDSRTDNHVWAETYERDRADLFAIQADVAIAIAQAMDAELTPETKASLTALPTTSTEAHDFYLRALDYQGSGSAAAREDRRTRWTMAVTMLEKAVAADARFAVAHAELGIAHLRMYWFGFDQSDRRRDLGKQSIDRALELAPSLPQARTALGYYHYWGMRDYKRALAAWTAAQDDLPGSMEIANLRAFVLRRMGRYEETIELLRKSELTDPRNSFMAFELAQSYMCALNYDEAIRWADKAIALAPEYPQPYGVKANVFLNTRGDIESARSAIRAGIALSPSDIDIVIDAFALEMLARNYAEALRLAEGISEELVENQEEFVSPALMKGLALMRLDRKPEARVQLERARQLLEAQVAANPNDYRSVHPLALTYGALGDRAKATEYAQRAVQLMPMSLDGLIGPFVAERAAHTYALIGDAQHATEQLALAVAAPARQAVRPPALRIDPRWDGIRNTPEFQRLLQ
jgi:TolB-like protein/Tfp pilus assembly protein PilF